MINIIQFIVIILNNKKVSRSLSSQKKYWQCFNPHILIRIRHPFPKGLAFPLQELTGLGLVHADYCWIRKWQIKCDQRLPGGTSMIMLSPIAQVAPREWGEARGSSRTGYGSLFENLASVQDYRFFNSRWHRLSTRWKWSNWRPAPWKLSLSIGYLFDDSSSKSSVTKHGRVFHFHFRFNFLFGSPGNTIISLINTREGRTCPLPTSHFLHVNNLPLLMKVKLL